LVDQAPRVPLLGLNFTEEWPGPAVNQDDKVKQFIKDEGWGQCAMLLCCSAMPCHALQCYASASTIAQYSPLPTMLADIFIKVIELRRFSTLRNQLGLKDITPGSEEEC
jgi:hypothetical protein